MELKSLNVPVLLNHFLGDEEILLEMINAFEEGAPSLLNLVREAIATQDADQLRINAHTFKGIMRSFYAEDGSLVAHELEMRGHNSAFDDALDILNRFENQLMLFLHEIRFLKKDLGKLP